MNCVEAGMGGVFLWASMCLALAQLSPSPDNAAYVFCCAAPVVAVCGFQAGVYRISSISKRKDVSSPMLVELKVRRFCYHLHLYLSKPDMHVLI